MIEKIIVFCGTCNKQLEIHPYKLKHKHKLKHKRHFCSRDCWVKAPNRTYTRREGSFSCKTCQQEQAKDQFSWIPNKATGRKYRNPHCKSCFRIIRQQKYLDNKTREKLSHRNWCEKSLNNVDDQASLLHFFKRKMGSLRRRSLKLKVEPPTVTPEFLVDLFNRQSGKCFYSGRQLLWRNFGTGHMSRKKSLLSIDRKDPLEGYWEGNVVLCTAEVNTLKWTNSVEELYSLCEEIIQQRNLYSISGPVQSNPV